MRPDDFLSLLLEPYRAHDAEEEALWSRMCRFVRDTPTCFARSHRQGHITTSAFVVDEAVTHTLLVHHVKLGAWLQPGGHIEEPDSPDLLCEALREVAEETGLKNVVPLQETLFDVDIHRIPERGHEPAHEHFDIRFLVQAKRTEPLVVSEESHDVRWFALDVVSQRTQSRSLLRMVEKATLLHGR